jgi:hypothetical protein
MHSGRLPNGCKISDIRLPSGAGTVFAHSAASTADGQRAVRLPNKTSFRAHPPPGPLPRCQPSLARGYFFIGTRENGKLRMNPPGI